MWKSVFLRMVEYITLFTDGNKNCHRTLDGIILLPWAIFHFAWMVENTIFPVDLEKVILNKREYLGPLAGVYPADDIPFCSIFTYFQYWLIHNLALWLISWFQKKLTLRYICGGRTLMYCLASSLLVAMD